MARAVDNCMIKKMNTACFILSYESRYYIELYIPILIRVILRDMYNFKYDLHSLLKYLDFIFPAFSQYEHKN